MSEQNIQIESNTGTVNIYSTGEEKPKTSETVTIAAVDKYSTPLRAEIEMTPWGENMHRVSFLMKNDLLGQVLQQNYYTYHKKAKAKETFKEIVKSIGDFKEKAEKERIHSAILIPQIWHKMALIETDVKNPEAKDLTYRFENPQIHDDFMGARPAGLVFHPVEDHFPEHEGILEDSKKAKFVEIGIDKFGNQIYYKVENGFIKTAKKNGKCLSLIGKKAQRRLEIFNKINDKWTSGSFDSKTFVIATKILPWDDEQTKTYKRKALLEVRPILKAKDPIKWAELNKNKINNAIDIIGESVFQEISNKNKINIEDYDLFIFDADNTIWNGDCPAMHMNPPFSRKKDTIIDSEGKEITLKEGVREILVTLREKGKDVGLVSKSERKGVDYQDQPVVLMLKQLGLLGLFNKMVVVDQDIPKSAFIPKEGRILFIDDDVDQIRDVEQHTGADTANAETVEFDENEILDFNKDLEPLEVIELDDGETLEDLDGWVENDDEILIPIGENTVIKARIKMASSGNWYRESKKDPNRNDVKKTIMLCEPISQSLLLSKSKEYDETLHNLKETASRNWHKESKKDPNRDYVECPKDCGPPSGSMGVHFELEKEDKKLWIPKSRLKEYNKTCKEIKEDLAKPQIEIDAPPLESKNDDWYKQSKREYIPVSERPDKPQDGKNYELDHKKSKNSKGGGGSDKKENLQWIEKDKHKEKSKNSGDFSDGGNKKTKYERSKGKSQYKNYQKSCGEARQKKEREEIGSAAYSKQQSNFARQRWDGKKKK